VLRYQDTFRHELGTALVFPSDELYLSAGVRPPAAPAYEGFPQYENGIGMVRVLLDDASLARRRIRASAYREPKIGRATLACGRLIAPTLTSLAAEVASMFGVRIDTAGVRNDFFGERVNVSGLLVGEDYAAQLAQQDLGDLVFLPRTSLDYYGRLFLDDTTPEELAAALGRRIIFVTTLTEVLEYMMAPPDAQVTGASRNAVTNGRSWV
jgi:NifB/MoaA-like Fe-S oxidoreductase